MASALPELPLLGSDALMQFLKLKLDEIEADEGCPDEEARALLLQLQQQTVLMQALSEQQGGPELTDLQLAEQIDSLDAQLSQLEASLSTADDSTMALLGQSTSKWLNTQGDGSQAGSCADAQSKSSSSKDTDSSSSYSQVGDEGAPAAPESSRREEGLGQKKGGDGITIAHK